MDNKTRDKFSFSEDPNDPLKPKFVTHNHYPRFTMRFSPGGAAGDFIPIAPIAKDEEYETLKREAREFYEKRTD